MKQIILIIYLSIFFAIESFSSTEFLLEMEQTRINRTVDESLIKAPSIEGQNSLYRPENKTWFDIKSVWVPEKELHIAMSKNGLPSELAELFVKEISNQKYYKLLIHPESENFYKEFLDKYPSFVEFEATSTSSSRTTLVRKKDNHNLKFFGKVSLDIELGGVVRTIPTAEVSRSVGISDYIDKVSPQLDKNFVIIPEDFGIAPKKMERGGMIIRPIPADVLSGKSKLVPLFSLYADSKDGTLLSHLAKVHNMSESKFVTDKILKPFHKAWVDWAINGSVVMEAHAQNVLLELDKNDKVTGRFFHRDLGGFNINIYAPTFEKRYKKDFIFFNNLYKEYHLKFIENAKNQSYRVYFEGGFLYNIDKHLTKNEPNYKKKSIYYASRRILLSNLQKHSITKIEKPFKIANIPQIITQIQKAPVSISSTTPLSSIVKSCIKKTLDSLILLKNKI